MLKDIVAVTALEGHRLHLRFEDGAEGEVDVAALVRFTGVFAPLEDAGYFAQVTLDRDLGSIHWPNGADIDPLVLYCRITGAPLPQWAHASQASNF
jgi:hypothetical protein